MDIYTDISDPETIAIISAVKIKNCNGSATLRGVSFFNLSGGSVSKGKAHNHLPIDGRKEVIEALTDLKSRSTLSNALPAAIVQDARHTVTISDSIEKPSTSALKQVVRRIRKKELPSEPECSADLVIPHSLKTTRNGEKNFLLFDTKYGDTASENEMQQEDARVIGFGTDDDLRKLASSHVWFLDGTFKTCPKLFLQIYTIHYMFHEKTFPAVYALLPGKTHPCLNY